MEILKQHELALHQPQIRKDISQVRQLLHTDFQEIGASGNTYTIESIIALMDSEPETKSYIHAQEFETNKLSDQVYHLTYKSCVVHPGDIYDNYAKRSSIWINETGSWQLKYHQGTPCPAFKLLLPAQ